VLARTRFYDRRADEQSEDTMTAPIYLDNNATTPIDPAVVDAIEPYLRDHFGNPSSDHDYGYRTRAAVQTARAQLASLLGAAPAEVVFTGGGSEANNLAIKGVAYALQARGNHLITSAVEHPAVVEPLHFLERQGYQVTTLPVDAHGQVDPAQVAAVITDRTILVSIMHANNEVGTIQPIRMIADIAHARGVLVHTDVAQTIGKLPVRRSDLGVDLLTVAGHKLYAPKGIGALIVRQDISLEPLIHGAGHEGGRRAGTENVPYMVGLGCAADLARERLPEYQERVRTLRDTLHRHSWSASRPPS
jgi:cysteine desulfurase